MTAILCIVVLGQWRDHGGAALDLADAVQDDFRAAVVGLKSAANLDGASGESANVAHVFQVVGEHHDHEGASHLFFTEVEKVDAFGADFDADNFPLDTLGLANVLAGLVDRDAIAGAG